jgi:UDP-N-acetyl-D-mannosaminuronic acid transferase (WecB/TagA/CpsF family)
MKKHITILTIAIIALTFSSCNKWLEEDKFAASTSDMFRDEANIIRLVGQAYADLVYLHDHWGYWGVATLASDEAVVPTRQPGGHWNDDGYWRSFATHNWSVNDESFQNVWRISMSAAVGCNRILKKLEDVKHLISEELYAEYVGELEVLRSYYFFTLFDCFGRIPYTEEFRDIPVPMMTVEEVWQNLVRVLEKNAPHMKVVTAVNRASLYGRATQGFAYALLARLYLNAKSYGVVDAGVITEADALQKVVEYTDLIIKANSYEIEPDFFTNFALDNSRSREAIFVIVENGDASFYSDDKKFLRLVMCSMHYSHQLVWNMREKPWNGFAATPELIKSYVTNNETVDFRGANPDTTEGTNAKRRWGWFVGHVAHKDGTILTIREPLNPRDTISPEVPVIITPEISSLTRARWNDGARLWKFEIDMEGRWKWMNNDFPLMRYADVLYMREEAILRGATGTSGLGGEMDLIRTRAGVEPYALGSLTLDELLDERGREFAWELVRRRDLIRFEKYSDPAWWAASRSWRTNVNTNKAREWFPIPARVLESNSAWTQNPGY